MISVLSDLTDIKDHTQQGYEALIGALPKDSPPLLHGFPCLGAALGPSYVHTPLKDSKAAGQYGKRFLFICLSVCKLWKEAELFRPCQELNTCC